MINGVSDEEKEKMEEAIRHAGSAFSLVRPKQESTGPQSTPGGSSASSPLGNSILPPAMTPNEEFSGAAAASPLQRMASITNSLISQPSTPTHHSANQRPLKAVLPPITQQQFDMYNNLNTEDIVKRVSSVCGIKHIKLLSCLFIFYDLRSNQIVKIYLPFTGKGTTVSIFDFAEIIRRVGIGSVSGISVRLVSASQTVAHADPKGSRALHPYEDVPRG